VSERFSHERMLSAHQALYERCASRPLARVAGPQSLTGERPF
jgi:hypothetical protein